MKGENRTLRPQRLTTSHLLLDVGYTVLVFGDASARRVSRPVSSVCHLKVAFYRMKSLRRWSLLALISLFLFALQARADQG